MAEDLVLVAARAAITSIPGASVRFAAALDLYDHSRDPQDLEQARTVLPFVLGAETICASSVELFSRSRQSADLMGALKALKDIAAGYVRWKLAVSVVAALAAGGDTQAALNLLEEVPEPPPKKEQREGDGRRYFRDLGFEAIGRGYLLKGEPDAARLVIRKIDDMHMRCVAWRSVYTHTRQTDDLLRAEEAALIVGTVGEMVAVRETEVDAWLGVRDERRAAAAAQKGATPEIRARLYHRILQYRTP